MLNTESKSELRQLLGITTEDYHRRLKSEVSLIKENRVLSGITERSMSKETYSKTRSDFQSFENSNESEKSKEVESAFSTE